MTTTARERLTQAQNELTLAQAVFAEAETRTKAAFAEAKREELEEAYARGRALKDTADSKTKEWLAAGAECADWTKQLEQADAALACAQRPDQLPEFPTLDERRQQERLIVRLRAERDGIANAPEGKEVAARREALRQELLVLDNELKAVRYAIRNLEVLVAGGRVGVL